MFSQNLSPNTTGSFVFTPQPPLNLAPIQVFYHIPNGDIKNMPILMSFHGANRDADNYRNYWINMANANGFMVFAPEFSSTHYPSFGDDYLLSNIFDDGDNPSPETYNSKNEWAFSALDPLFEYIKADISGNQQDYSGWGHSGGAQFLHRLMIYLPNNKLDIAVCSNSGWYTVPENTVSFPYGILNGQLPSSDLILAFSKKLVVHLGQNDTDPNSGLRRNAIVDAQQGIQRFERGNYFFTTSQNTAQNMAATFNWEKHEVSGVGHDAQLMANDALQYLLPSLLSNNNFGTQKSINIFPNPTSLGHITISKDLNTPLQIIVYNILGKQVLNQKIMTSKLDVSSLKKGVYFIKIIENKTNITTKKLIIE